MAETTLTIGQVAARTGLSVHTLRLYEREGLLAGPVQRNSAGRRVYTDADVQWLFYCTKFRASDMPLAVIRQFAHLALCGPSTERERLDLLLEHQRQLAAKIAELTDCLAVISEKVEVYQHHLSQGDTDDLWRVPAARTQVP